MGANFLSQSCSVANAKPITFRQSNENRSTSQFQPYRTYVLTVQQPCRLIGTKESVYVRKELNSHRIGLAHQRDRFIVLEHQYGCHEVMCKCSKPRIQKWPIYM